MNIIATETKKKRDLVGSGTMIKLQDDF